MKKVFGSLPFRLLLGIAIGIVCGLFFPESIMKVIVTLKYIMGQLITFCVPLIVIGFIAPSITKLGSNASRLLGVAVVIAYASSIGAAILSMLAGYGIIPHLSIDNSVEGLRELPGVVFQLDIPQIMPVMSALVLSILLGLAVTWTKSARFAELLGEFQNVVLSIVSKVVIPVLPFYIAATFCALSYEGMITRQLPAFLQIIVIVIVGHFIWMALLYLLAGAYSKKNSDLLEENGIGFVTRLELNRSEIDYVKNHRSEWNMVDDEIMCIERTGYLGRKRHIFFSLKRQLEIFDQYRRKAEHDYDEMEVMRLALEYGNKPRKKYRNGNCFVNGIFTLICN